MLGIIALAVQAGASIYGGIQAQRMAGQQRRVANRMAEGVLQRGAFEAEQYQRQLDQLIGRQTVGIAAQDIDLTSGTAALIGEQTREAGAQDLAQIRENARLEAWGIRRQGAINARGLQNQAIGSFLSAGTTLLTSPFGQDSWSRFTGRRKLGTLENKLGGF